MEDITNTQLKPKFNFFRILFCSNSNIFYIILIPICIGLIASGASIFALFLLLITIASIEFSFFMNYKATTYTISQDKILFEEGFINHQSSSVSFQNIKEIHLTQSIVQRFFKLGTIRLLTAGSNQVNGGGIKLQDLDSSAAVYMFLNKILNSILNEKSGSIKYDKDKTITLKPDFKTKYYLVDSAINAIIIAFVLSFIIFLFTQLLQNLILSIILPLLSFILLSFSDFC